MPRIKRKPPRRRHQLLLEVMIAFALIVICIIPLLQPHWFMLRYQQDFIKQVELDHVVNLLYGNMVEKLYMNDIEWRDLENTREEEISDRMLQSVGYSKPLPFKGTYKFKVIHEKHSKKKNLSAYVYGLDYTFDTSPLKQTYRYEFFLVRDLTKGENEKPETETPQEEEE